MKKFVYSLIIISILFSSVGIILPTDAYALTCPSGETTLRNPDGSFRCGVPPQGPTIAEIGRTIISFGKCALSPFDCAAIAILGLTGYLLYGAGIVLNFAVAVTILNMSSFIKNIDAIDIAWAAFRDLANIFFIFVLIYISVSTILGLSSGATKKKLATVVVVALLINFSLFFTKAIIDTSNIVTIQFYNAIAPGGDSLDTGLSGIFTDRLELVSIFDTKTKTSAAGYYDSAFDSVKGVENPFTVATMGSLFFLIAAFVFIAAAILLITRFVILIFLMIMSPLAYVGMILPKGEGMSKKWWDSLIDQCLFAPVLMMFLWVTASIINHPSFATIISGGNPTNATFANAIGENTPSNVWVIFNFMVIISLLITSLIAAKRAGAAGSGFATKLAAGATIGGAAWLGRNTAGRVASRIARSERFQEFAGRYKGAEIALKGVRGVANSSMDVRATKLGDHFAKETGLETGKASGIGGFNATLNKQSEEGVLFGRSLDRSPAGRQAYATRLATSPLASGGSRNSLNSIFGTMGRKNRVVAARLLRERSNELRTEINQLNQELSSLQRVAAPTPSQLNRIAELTGPATNNQSIAHRVAERNRLEAQMVTLELAPAPLAPGAPPGTPAPTSPDTMRQQY